MSSDHISPHKKAKTDHDVNKAAAPFLSPPRELNCTMLKRRITPTVDEQSTDLNQSDASREMRVKKMLLKLADYDIDEPSNTKKRQNYMSWDDYFMAISFLSAQRSRDPEDQIGACIVNEDNRIVGIGYNGFPRNCPDECLPWATTQEESNVLHTKDLFMCHAEVNAILNKISPDVKNCRMYVSKFPCNECAKVIIQAGITEIIYERDIIDCDSTRASRIMFQMAGIKIQRHQFSNPVAPLDFSSCEEISQMKDKDKNNCSSLSTAPDDSISKYKQLLKDEADYDPTKSNVSKREGYLSWDDYFTAVAYLTARRSKDPSTQVGAAIVDANNCIIGVGYNGFPRDCSDDYLPWGRSGNSELQTKYPFVVHAEVNAILNKGSKDVRGSRLYVALFPCNNCAKVIIQAGIKEVVYLSDKYHDTASCKASRIMFQMAGVKTRMHVPTKKYITIVRENE